MFSLYIFIFLICCASFYFCGEWVIGGLIRIAKFLGWREFVVAFFVMAFAASLPNFFVGITSALHGIPQLSFGDVAGNNLVALTLGVAIAVFFAKAGLPAESKTVQMTSVFTMISAILPLLLIFDGVLSRTDGILLISFFVFYTFWLFSKKERFAKIYDEYKPSALNEFKNLMRDIGKVIVGIIILIIASQGIVFSAQFFAKSFDIPLVLIGLLITGVGSTLPEIYFAVISAKKGESWMILGDLMGAVIFPATLVLGVVALIQPIKIYDSSPLLIARTFLIFSALFFFLFVRTGRKITKKEAVFLFGLYITFVFVEIFAR